MDTDYFVTPIIDRSKNFPEAISFVIGEQISTKKSKKTIKSFNKNQYTLRNVEI